MPHAFPQDFYGVFGMDVRSCVEYYKQSLARWAECWGCCGGCCQGLLPGLPGLPGLLGQVQWLREAGQMRAAAAAAAAGSMCWRRAAAPTGWLRAGQRQQQRLRRSRGLRCRHDWEDVEALARQVTQVKERHYQELTAGGISAFDGAAQLIARARQLGVVLGVGSSGAPAKIHHNLKSSGLLEHLQPEVGTRAPGRLAAAGEPLHPAQPQLEPPDAP